MFTRLCAHMSNPRPRAGGFVQMRAFSKINLILDVVKKRTDGYHELRSIMQTLALHDTITIEIMEENTEESLEGLKENPESFILSCDDQALPVDNRNLVTKAAKYIIEEYNITQPIRIQLEKRIPQAAGLGGGSSDCAATMVGLDKLFNLNIPLHSGGQCTHSLMSIGKGFGADVPFFLLGGTALAEGIGEQLTPLSPHPHCWVVLACPDIHVSTAEIFGKWKSGITSHSNITSMIQAIELGDVRKISDYFGNDFTQITTGLHPSVHILIKEMKSQGALNASMSGTGPTVFGYFDHKETAEKAQKHMYNMTRKAFLTEIYGGA